MVKADEIMVEKVETLDSGLDRKRHHVIHSTVDLCTLRSFLALNTFLVAKDFSPCPDEALSGSFHSGLSIA